MEMLFAYLAGLLTLINPCVLPVLPIVLASALQSSKWGPIALAAGMSITFVSLGLVVELFRQSTGINQHTIARFGALAMVGFGAILVFPILAGRFETAFAGLAGRADAKIDTVDQRGEWGQFIGGALLGVVWAPCIGPTLGAAMSFASTGGSAVWAVLIMSCFALGVSTIIVVLAYGAQSAIRARAETLRAIAQRSKPVMGVIFILVGLGLYFHVFRAAEIWLLDHLPYWLQDLSVRF